MTLQIKSFQSGLTRRAAMALISFATLSAQAQPTGLLYDPEPPVDSGYVRVMLATDMAKVSVVVDGKPRVPSLSTQQTSDYMVMVAGKHQIELMAAGKTLATTALDVARGTAVTVAFTSATAPVVFIDKTSTNKLKAMLNVYQLASKTDPLDVLTGDGATKVFSGLPYGKSDALQVNPISVELMAALSGGKTPLTRASLTMTQGGAYSVFLLSTKKDKVTAVVVQNKIERYTGK